MSSSANKQPNQSDDLPGELRQLFSAARQDVAPAPDVTARVRNRIAELPRPGTFAEPWAELRSWPMLAATTLATLAASIALVICLRRADALFDPMANVLQSLTMVMQ